VSKTILYCADGTWNGPPSDPAYATDIDATTNAEQSLGAVTNVYKLFVNLAGAVTPDTLALPTEQEKVQSAGDGSALQVAKYMFGVGDSNNQAIRILAGVFGFGVIARIVRGYTYISRQYQAGDTIHIAGFSRGAYTARALAGMICAVGLLNPSTYDVNDRQQAYLLGYAAWLKARGVVFGGGGTISRFLTGLFHEVELWVSERLASGETFIPGVPIASVAVWDTVGALGLPLYVHDGRRDAFSFVDTKLNPLVLRGFHAMALDERRLDFPVTRWDPRDAIEQVWFAGAHSDVGGGYPPAESGLSDLALSWMMGRLSGLGVRWAVPLPVTPDLTHYTQDFHRPWESPPFNIDPRPRVPLKDDAYSATVQARWEQCTPYQQCWPGGFAGSRLV